MNLTPIDSYLPNVPAAINQKHFILKYLDLSRILMEIGWLWNPIIAVPQIWRKPCNISLWNLPSRKSSRRNTRPGWGKKRRMLTTIYPQVEHSLDKPVGPISTVVFSTWFKNSELRIPCYLKVPPGSTIVIVKFCHVLYRDALCCWNASQLQLNFWVLISNRASCTFITITSSLLCMASYVNIM